MVFEGERCLKYNKVDNNNMIGTLYNLHTFDFDGTLTKRDTLIEFIRFAKGDKFFLKCMLRFSPLLLAMKMGLYPNETVKQKVLSYCFKGMATDLFNDLCRLFARTKKGLLRKKPTLHPPPDCNRSEETPLTVTAQDCSPHASR